MKDEICSNCKTDLTSNLAESSSVSNDRFMFCSEKCFRVWESKSYKA